MRISVTSLERLPTYRVRGCPSSSMTAGRYGNSRCGKCGAAPSGTEKMAATAASSVRDAAHCACAARSRHLAKLRHLSHRRAFDCGHEPREQRPLLVNQTMANGPPQENSRQANVYYPHLRPGYIPIPVLHDGLDNRQQYSYSHLQQPGVQRVRCEPNRRPLSPLQSFNRPQSPAWSPPESPQADKLSQHSGSAGSPGSSQGPSPPPSVVDAGSRSQSPGMQPPGRSIGGHQLPRGYIPIPVIHEGNGSRQSPVQQSQKTIYPQQDYHSHQPVFHKVQDERDSKQPMKTQTSSRDSSPASSPAPSTARVQIPVQRISPSRVQMDGYSTTVPVQMSSSTTVPIQMSPTSSVPLQTRSATSTPSPASSSVIDPIQVCSAASTPKQMGNSPATTPTQREPSCTFPTQTTSATADRGQFSNTVPAHAGGAEAEFTSSTEKPEKGDVQSSSIEVEKSAPKETVPEKEPEVIESQEKPPGVLQVERILGRVQALEEAVTNFKGRKNEKKYLILEEDLTKELLALDSVDPEGRADVRQARKDGVRKVQNILETLEQKATDNQSAGSQDPEEASNVNRDGTDSSSVCAPGQTSSLEPCDPDASVPPPSGGH